MSCKFCKNCTFYTDSAESKVVALLRSVYCRNRPAGCALHMIRETLGFEHVPPTLYPNQTHLVPSIIRSGQKPVLNESAAV